MKVEVIGRAKDSPLKGEESTNNKGVTLMNPFKHYLETKNIPRKYPPENF